MHYDLDLVLGLNLTLKNDRYSEIGGLTLIDCMILDKLLMRKP